MALRLGQSERRYGHAGEGDRQDGSSRFVHFFISSLELVPQYTGGNFL
jgi:hypothetical protein